MSRNSPLIETAAFPNLTTGSKIGIFAPSYAVSAGAIERGVSTLEKAGFTVDCPDDLISPPFDGCPWANSKEERTRRIINMLNDPEIEAIWAVNGGESGVDVVNLLAQYNKNPVLIKKQIEDSYRDRFGEVPADFFRPICDSFDYSSGALPKRGIPCIGFSDVSGINNFLGQNGIVSPYYADVLDSRELEKVLQHLTGEKEVSKYEGLKLLSAESFVAREDETLQIYATVDGWIGLSCGTDFQFSLRSPTILAIESIESINMMGHTLQQALEAGALENVKAIVIGRTKDGQVGSDLEKYPPLKEFIEKSGIAVFTTDGDLTTGRDTFGHGKGGISEPFANFAKSSLDEQEDGSYILQIDGKRSLKSLTSSYESQSSHARNDESVELFSSHKTISENISVDPESLQLISGATDASANLSGAKIISTNFQEFYCTSGTLKQTSAAGKVLLVSADQNTDFLHQALVGNHLSGVSNGASAIIVATPPYQERASLEMLQTFTDPSCKYEKGEIVDGFETWNLRLPKPPFDNRLKHDLDKINDGSIRYDATDSGGFVDIGITILDKEKMINRHQNLEQEKTDVFKEMLADAQKSYFPEIPLYFVEDKKLVRTFEDGVQVGRLFLEKSQEKISTEENQFETIQNESKKETDGRFVRGFSGDKKAKEFEDIGSDSKKSWVDRILNSNQSRDDYVIKR
jgi:muramoyltetrapeptide carboxypeptidase LdcA involved in peptidoglycan recycling